jgi:O-antigen ligase
MLIGIPFALYARIAFETVVINYSLAVVLFIVITVYYNNEIKLKKIMAVLLFTNVFIIIISLMNYENMYSMFGRFELANTGFDPNDTVFILLSLMPGSIYFTKYSTKKIFMLISFSVTIINIFLIVQTGSRGGFLGLITFMALYGVELMRGKNIIRNIILVTISISMFTLFLNTTDQRRIFEIFSPTKDYNYSSEEGRIKIWKYAIEIIADNPIFGVGASCFPEAIGRIREERNLPQKWQTAHNTYLQIGSEIGLIGLIIFITLMYKTYNNINRSDNNYANIKYEIEMKYISRCINIGFISLTVCALFLSQAYSIIFPFYIAIGESISGIKNNLFNKNGNETMGYENSE